MARETPRRRRCLAFDGLEGRALLATGVDQIASPNEVTPLFQGGFGPTSLQLSGSASLAGPRLRLTDGGVNQTAAAYYATPVDVSGAFTTSFRFQITPHGSDPLGEGFTFILQNNSLRDFGTFTDGLGLSTLPHVTVKFDTYNDSGTTSNPNFEYSDNSTGLLLGSSAPGFTDNTEIDIPKDLIDFHSQHVFEVTLRYEPPAGTAPGTLTETIADQQTGSSWSHVYSGVDLEGFFRLEDVTGQYAYAGFTASTGGPDDNADYTFGKGRSTQDILSWTWDTGGAAASLPYRASFTLGGPGTTAGAVLDAHGDLVRTLWQASPLPAGTYPVLWDGLDQHGRAPDPAAHPGPYSFDAVVSGESYAVHVIANDTPDPTSGYASIGAVGVYGVAVAPDGSDVWAADFGADTAMGGAVKQFDGSGAVDVHATQWLETPFAGSAAAVDSRYLYLAVKFGYGGTSGVVKFDRTTFDQATAFTDTSASNPDGSRMVSDGTGNYLRIFGDSPDTVYWALPAVAVSNYDDPAHGTLWVADVQNNLVRRYDKLTGDQAGAALPVGHPTGLAVDPSGDLWVAHAAAASGPSDLISVYGPDGAFLRDVTELTGLGDVVSLAIANGKLYVADHGAGRVLVYATSGRSVTDPQDPQQVGRPATYGSDDGRSDFWDLRAVAADAAGNIYTAQNTTGPGALGAQLEKWSPSGTPVWVKGGYEYQSVAGAYSRSDPTTLYSSSLHRYKLLDPTTGAWQYTGSAVYPGYQSDPWTGLKTAAPAAPPKFVRLGGTDFFTLSAGDRLLFFRVNPDGSLHPAAAVGTRGLADGDAWTWADPAGDGVAQDAQVQDSGVNVGAPYDLHVDALGNLWYSRGDDILEVPLQGLNGRGNPVYDWSRSARVLTSPATLHTFDVGDDGVYAEVVDPGLSPEPSLSLYAGVSMGGANALAKFDFGGDLLWTVHLPENSQSLAAVPGGGAVVGGMIGCVIYHVTASGQLTGSARPLGGQDCLDYRGGAIAVSRSPVDGLVDVFAEGIGYSDSEWYRLDDRAPGADLRGVAALGASVALAPAAGPGAPALLAADDSGVVGDGVTNVNRPRLTGTAQAGTTVQLLDPSGAVVGTAASDGSGAYTVTPSAPLADGTYTLSVRTIDAAGDLSAPSPVFTLTVATTPPAAPTTPALLASDDTGTPGDGITSVRQPHLVGSAEAGATVQLLNASGAVIGSGTAGPDGSYSVVVASPLANGTYTVAARAVDVAGNVGPASGGFSLTIVNGASTPATPSAPSLLPADDSGAKGDGLTNVRQPHLVGTGPAGLTVQVLNASGVVVSSATVAADGTYSVAPTSPLDDGAYSLQARAQDSQGNLSALSAAFSLTIDTTPPAAPPAPSLMSADDSGVKGDGITNVKQPRMTGTAEANATVRLVTAAGAVIGAATADAAGAYTVAPWGPLSDGAYAVRVLAVDAAGNVGAAGPALSLTILSTPPPTPAAPALYPADDNGIPGDRRTTVRQPRLTGTAPPGDSVDLLDAHGAVIASTTAAAGTGAYTLQPSASLGTGAVALTVRARDAAGNVGPASPALNLTILDAPVDDFDGDGKTDYGLFRQATAQWISLNSNGSGAQVTPFGAPNLSDIPVPGDYDGTGKAEFAVFRPSTAQWIIASPTGARVVTLGAPNLFDIPVPGDYDHVGHTEFAVYRPSTGQWIVDGPKGAYVVTFGVPNLVDIPAPGDYFGVGYTEFAVYRPSTGQWIVAGPTGGLVLRFGAPNLFDVPVAGDYDGVGHSEFAVYRPSTGQWIVAGPTGGRVFQFGAPSYYDVPLNAPTASLKKLGVANRGGVSAQSLASGPRSAAEAVAPAAGAGAPASVQVAAPPPAATAQSPAAGPEAARGRTKPVRATNPGAVDQLFASAAAPRARRSPWQHTRARP